MQMTDDERELAEYVARWAGWECLRTEESDWYDGEGMPVDFEQILTDRALAWQAEDELIEIIGPEMAAKDVSVVMLERGRSRMEATFRCLRLRVAVGGSSGNTDRPGRGVAAPAATPRAHRAVFGGDGDG